MVVFPFFSESSDILCPCSDNLAWNIPVFQEIEIAGNHGFTVFYQILLVSRFQSANSPLPIFEHKKTNLLIT